MWVEAGEVAVQRAGVAGVVGVAGVAGLHAAGDLAAPGGQRPLEDAQVVHPAVVLLGRLRGRGGLLAGWFGGAAILIAVYRMAAPVLAVNVWSADAVCGRLVFAGIEGGRAAQGCAVTARAEERVVLGGGEGAAVMGDAQRRVDGRHLAAWIEVVLGVVIIQVVQVVRLGASIVVARVETVGCTQIAFQLSFAIVLLVTGTDMCNTTLGRGCYRRFLVLSTKAAEKLPSGFGMPLPTMVHLRLCVTISLGNSGVFFIQSLAVFHIHHHRNTTAT
mmetsp:Transcript_3265/g.6793  ORF Transcript_3265/g.6793 Transcript_3265/m.6793 type:complete len:274 (+) Transcript_3265:1269-2090(+)